VICVTDSGVDLFAFALLIATLRDWLVICHRSVPVVFSLLAMETGRWVVLADLKSGSKHARSDHQV
jgi:hypothetical protein